jgi:hypothetical protein
MKAALAVIALLVAVVTARAEADSADVDEISEAFDTIRTRNVENDGRTTGEKMLTMSWHSTYNRSHAPLFASQMFRLDFNGLARANQLALACWLSVIVKLPMFCASDDFSWSDVEEPQVLRNLAISRLVKRGRFRPARPRHRVRL